MSSSSVSVCVVGAGAAGLAAATRLAEETSVAVTVLEASDRVGGRICTSRMDGDAMGETTTTTTWGLLMHEAIDGVHAHFSGNILLLLLLAGRKV
jgi:monoamine oxidase